MGGGISDGAGHDPRVVGTNGWNLGLPSFGFPGNGQGCTYGNGSDPLFNYGFTASPTGAYDTASHLIHSDDVGPNANSTSTIVFITDPTVMTSTSPLLGVSSSTVVSPGVIWECWVFYPDTTGLVPGDTPDICPAPSAPRSVSPPGRIFFEGERPAGYELIPLDVPIADLPVTTFG